MAARIWACLFFLSVLGGWAALNHNTRVMKEREKVLSIGRDGSVIYGVLDDFGSSDELFDWTTRNFLRAIFERNPNGVDEPRLLDRLFLEESRKQAAALIGAGADDFKKKAIFQSVKLGPVKFAKLPQKIGDKEAYLVQFQGQAIKNGTVDGLSFQEPTLISGTITLIRNDDIVNNNFFPLVVLAFTLKEDPIQ